MRYRAAFAILVLIVLGKFTGLLKDVLLTYYHGVSTVTDAFFLASSVSGLLYMAVYAAVPVLIVPLYSRWRSGDIAARSRVVFAGGYLVAVSAVITVVVFAFGTLLVGLVAEGASNVQLLAANYLRVMALGFAFSTAVAFCNAIQSVDGRVFPSYVVPVANNLFFCVGILFFGSDSEFVYVLALGVMAWVVLLAINAAGLRGRLSELFSDFAWEQRTGSVITLLVPAIFAFYVEQMNGYAAIYIASSLPDHAISVWSYANKLGFIIASVFLVFLTTSLFPAISQFVAEDKPSELASYLARCFCYIVVFVLPPLAYVAYFSNEVVSLLFRRGSFTQDDAMQVATILTLVLAAVPLGLMRDTLNRVLFAYGNNVLPLVLTIGSLVLTLALGIPLAGTLGLTGLALAVVLSALCNAAVLVALVRKKLAAPMLSRIGTTLFASLVSLGLAFLLLIAIDGVSDYVWIAAWLPFGLIYATFAYLFGVDEVRGVLTGVRARISLLRPPSSGG